ncbi:pentatricopeptide repeat-containing protein At1g74630 [Henckelia pumila]|uniref:pentatricopeptide repeat-containing protein At1g74630 n=1 Tax=Henckelia pumila TaxID=405737 RepID=UPI003C6DFC99
MSSAEQVCVSLLNYCKNIKSLQQLHARTVKGGLDSDPFVTGKFILHCSVRLSAALDYAQRLLLHAANPDVFMYNTLIRGFSDSEFPQNSIFTFILMLKNLGNPPDSFSFAFTLKAAANMRCFRSGIQLHCQSMKRGINTHLFVATTLIRLYAECGCILFSNKVFDEIADPNVVSWNAILTAFFRCDDVRGVERLFNLMPLRNSASYNLMLAAYAKTGELDSARKLFVDMPIKDDVSWNTMIVGFAQNGCFDEAFGYFRELQKVGLRPNEVSLTAALSACAQAGALEFAKILHGFVEKAGLVWITPVNNALTDTYSKCGSIDMARLVFERMPGKRSIVTWTSMIIGLAIQGHGEEALNLFIEMEASGIIPDGIAFIVILYACSHAGLVEQGCDIFDKMTNVYRIKPTIEHYGCMVDLYGRAGQLVKAYNFVSEMPIPPSAIIWRTLLGACSFHGNVKLAEEVKKRLSELDPEHSGDHILLSNIYAGAGQWTDVAKLRRSMAEEKITKTPGWSMIEVEKVMYTFVAGAKQDDVTTVAYKKLEEILFRLRLEGGYMPNVVNVLHDIEEEEKENAVITHSEKLAVAFGVARLREGGILRIVKNLRVCKDCHTVMKLISKVYEVEITLRDRSRYHSFKNGVCSCRDYW